MYHFPFGEMTPGLYVGYGAIKPQHVTGVGVN